MPDTVEELNDLISKLNFLKTNFPDEEFLKTNFPDEEERQRRRQQFYGKVQDMDVDINSFESIEDAITSAEKLKLKKEKEQEENGRETNFNKMLESKRRITIKKRPEMQRSDKNKFKPIDGAKLADILTKRNRKDSKDSNSSSDEELNAINAKKRRGGGRRTRGKKRTRKRRRKRTRKRRKSRRRKRHKSRRKRKR